jgi:3-oxocholest-4-en-26-oate---CoA ligase
MMTGWDFAALWWRIAALQPHQPALLHGDTAISWAEFDGQATAVAAALRSAGLDRGDVVAICLPNVPEHIICLAACLRSALTPANVNPRYRGPELDRLTGPPSFRH